MECLLLGICGCQVVISGWDWLCLLCKWSLFLVVYDVVGRISRLRWLYGWGSGCGVMSVWVWL